MRIFQTCLKPVLYLWALPATAIGLACVPLAWLSGGNVAFRDGVVEVSGGLVGWLLAWGRPFPIIAITFGHSILAYTQAGLHLCREHEHIHVRQYERWGPLFIPLYLTLSLIVWWQGGDPYRDNRFEREAFRETDGGG